MPITHFLLALAVVFVWGTNFVVIHSGLAEFPPFVFATLRFIRRSRDLGFSMAEIGELLALWQNRRRPSSSVKRIATEHVAALDAKMAEMAAMRKTLQHLVHCCHGDDRPECPILDELAKEPARQ